MNLNIFEQDQQRSRRTLVYAEAKAQGKVH